MKFKQVKGVNVCRICNTAQKQAEIVIGDYERDLETIKAKKQEAYKYIEGLVKLEKVLKRAIKQTEEAAL